MAGGFSRFSFVQQRLKQLLFLSHHSEQGRVEKYSQLNISLSSILGYAYYTLECFICPGKTIVLVFLLTLMNWGE